MLGHGHILATLLAGGLVAQALAEPSREEFRPHLARMSTQNLLGLNRRTVEGYSPTEQLCSDGDTCAEACGKGFKQCASADKLKHCYNPLKNQTCCPGGTGDSCDHGYFCSADTQGETWCCPEGISLKQCARRYGIPGVLTSQAPHRSTKTEITTKTVATESRHSSTTKKHVTTTTKSKDAEKHGSPNSTTKTSSTSTSTSIFTSTSRDLHRVSTSTRETQSTSIPEQSGETTSRLPVPTTTTTTTTNVLLSTEPPATEATLLLTTAPSTHLTPSPTGTKSHGGIDSHQPAIGSVVMFVLGALAALV
ncbi:hypothetical protein GGS20DRAFT_559495 [Poronia punctata]|nr:hypothetical protein GGS20DRAFT_559495 [Poronia punctata]